MFLSGDVTMGELSRVVDQKVVAFIVARLSSSRFPAKHLRAIGDKRIIDWTIEGLKLSRQIDQIVIATVAEPENEPLRQIAFDEQVEFFWFQGEVDHVTTRLRKAAEHFAADICLLISGDCPLIHAPLLDQMVADLKACPEADYVKVPPDADGNPSMTEGLGVYRSRAWQKGDDLSDRPELKEHQFPILGQRPDIFCVCDSTILPAEFYGAKHRLSIDTRADLEFMNLVHDELLKAGQSFDLPSVASLIDDQEHFKEINAHVYQRQLVEHIRRALFVVDAGGDFGYGHLMRSIELAHQLVERKGYPVSFLVDDLRAWQMLKEQGLTAFWGAYGRAPRAPSEGIEALTDVDETYDFVIFDIYGGRSIEAGWRNRDFPKSCLLAMDSLASWTAEVDLVVIPGVTAPENPESFYGESPPVIHLGEQFVILRQEVRQAKRRRLPKEIDLLVYLHKEEQRQAVKSYAAASGLSVHIVEGFEQDFCRLLAKSRCYLGNFGYGFYEAVSLGAYPLNWPLSKEHEEDSRLFYERMGLPAEIVTSAEQLGRRLPDLLHKKSWEALSLEDGTAAIVDLLVALRNRQEAIGTR